MHERPSFWKHFSSERIDQSLKLLKSAEKYLYPTLSSFWANLSWKKSFWLRSEILGLLVNRLTANYEPSRSNTEIYDYHFKCNHLKNQNIFAIFYCIFRIFVKFGTFWKKMIFIAPVLPKLLSPQDVLTEIHERSCFWKHFGSERVNEFLKLFKLAEKYLHSTFSSFWANLS